MPAAAHTYLIVFPGRRPRRHSLFIAGTWPLRPAVARGAARCASQVLDRVAQVDARSAAQVLDRGAQAAARGTAR